MRARRTTGRRTALLAALALAVTGLGAVQVAAGGPASAATGARGVTPVAPTRIVDTRFGIGAPRRALGPDGTLSFQATGSTPEIPATGVAAVVVNVSAVSPTASGWMELYPSGVTRPTATSHFFAAGASTTNLMIVKVGAGGKVDVFNRAGSTEVVVDITGWIPAGGEFTGMTPARLMDTRTGLGAPKVPVGPGGSVTLQVTGRNGIPAGVEAVVLTVTGVSPTADSWVAVHPAGTVRATATELNLTRTQSRTATVVAKVGAGGKVTLFNASGSVHLLVDAYGWFGAGSQLLEQAPYRLVDTRHGIGVPTGALIAGRPLVVTATLPGGAALPASQAALVSVTAIQSTAATSLQVSPEGVRFDVNSMSAPTGRNVSNTALVELRRTVQGGVTTWSFQLTTSQGATHVTVDVLALVSPELTVTTPPLPAGQRGVAYSRQLATTGGTAPYTYDIVDGSLPPGLTMSPTGLISGTPTAVSIFPFRVRARDDASHTGALYQRITINP